MNDDYFKTDFSTTTKNYAEFTFSSDLDFIKIKLGQLTSQLYQLESMIYLTTGLIDEYENPKVDYETAMVKVWMVTVVNYKRSIMIHYYLSLPLSVL